MDNNFNLKDNIELAIHEENILTRKKLWDTFIEAIFVYAIISIVYLLAVNFDESKIQWEDIALITTLSFAIAFFKKFYEQLQKQKQFHIDKKVFWLHLQKEDVIKNGFEIVNPDFKIVGELLKSEGDFVCETDKHFFKYSSKDKILKIKNKGGEL